MKLEKIIIYNKNLTAGASFEELLHIIKDKYSNSQLSFLGWIRTLNVHVIEIDSIKYKVLHFNDKIELRETRSNEIKVSEYATKKEAYKKYNEILQEV